jgi:hypothetical protein
MIDARHFNNTGYLVADLTPEQVAPVWEEINKLKNNPELAEPYNEYHTGHLQTIYKLKDCMQHVEDMVIPFVQKHEEQFGHLKKFSMLTESVPVKLYDLFVNIQKKYEFNPIHNHDGAMSFVFYLKVPYLIEDEIGAFGKNSNRPVTAHFQFTVTDTLGRIMNLAIPIDKRFENKLLVFPAQMFHSVYPFFSSDDERISVAGNFKFKVK